MPVSFSVKNVPEGIAEALRSRARRNHRSLQGELLAILEEAAAPEVGAPNEVHEAAQPWPAPKRAAETGRHPPATQPGFSIDRAALAAVCRRHHIRRLSVFGSALRDDFGPESDVDFLVEFEEGSTPGFGIFDIESELSALVGGRKVDLVSRKSLNPRLKPIILGSARELYAEG